MMVVSVPVSHRQARFMAPIWGLPSMPQAIAVRNGGMKNGRVIRTSRRPRIGVSVRARIQASSTASTTAMKVLTNAIARVSFRMVKFRGEDRGDSHRG